MPIRLNQWYYNFDKNHPAQPNYNRGRNAPFFFIFFSILPINQTIILTMRNLGLILFYIALTMFFYFLLSTIGCLFYSPDGNHYSYIECIGNLQWFIFYIALIHWLPVLPCVIEYYEKYIVQPKNTNKPE